MNPGESPEKEPIVGHCIDHSRHGEHGTQEAGGDNGSVRELVEGQDRPQPAWGQVSLPLLSQAQGLGYLRISQTGRKQTLTWMKEHRGFQQPRCIWQGPIPHGETPVAGGCRDESGSRAS